MKKEKSRSSIQARSNRALFRRQATLNDFATRDVAFMEKISMALTTVHETYGYKAVQDCLKINEESGDAEVDIEILCAMMDRSQTKLKHECCKMFFASKSILGSFMYLFGSLVFGGIQYFNNQLTWQMKAFLSIAATTFYLIGGILFIIAAIEPYWQKTLEINAVAHDVYQLRSRGSLVRKMGRKQKGDTKIRTRMSKLNIDTKAMLLPNELEAAENERKELARMTRGSIEKEDFFTEFGNEQHDKESDFSKDQNSVHSLASDSNTMNSSKFTPTKSLNFAPTQQFESRFSDNNIHVTFNDCVDEIIV